MAVTLRAIAVLGLTMLAGCGRRPVDGRLRAAALLDAGRIDSARAVVAGLEREMPGDTGVLGLEVRLYSAERRLAAATDAYRDRREHGGNSSPGLLLDLLDAAFHDVDPYVAIAALEGCGRLGIDTMYRSVVLACVDANPDVREAAIDAIGRLPLREEGTGRLAWGALDGEDRVRIAAVDALIRLRHPDGWGLTWTCRCSDNDYLQWRLYVLAALLGDEEAQAQVRSELDSGLDLLEIGAADCLVRLGERRQLARIARGLRAGEALARSYAAMSLGELGATEHRGELVAATRDSDEGVRWRASQALGQLGDTLARAALVALLGDGSDRVRGSAVIAYARLSGPGDDAALLPLLADSSLTVRAAAVSALYALAASPAPELP